MNRLYGKIIEIETSEEMSLACVDIGNSGLLIVALIETPATCEYLRIGKEVCLVFKETEVVIGKNLAGGISILNRNSGTVNSVKHGMLLSRFDIDYRGVSITAVISKKAAESIELSCGDHIEWFVKANEIMIMENDER